VTSPAFVVNAGKNGNAAMALIEFTDVCLEYPVRQEPVSLKEYIVRGLFGRSWKNRRKKVRSLNNTTFRIGDGERVGIIGHNGAGKSTLLRAIAGVYPICAGESKVVGTVCSLFDISVGFEMDATGWENIYYRCYLQGDTPRQVETKLQAIADFTELGDFLDMPLRCYSTGMAMRLAFAVATSSDPEILLIDEVFGTGDRSFQKKAEARLKDLFNRASVVISVSHNLELLRRFSQRVLWLDHGSIRADGPADEVISEYLKSINPPAAATVAA
jgi:ABC-type polysaccharide/polyol phosphate transport system ATPase subunit